MTNALVSLLLIAAMSVSASAAIPRPLRSDVKRVLASFKGMFGESVDPTNHLYEVNRLYVAQVTFDRLGRLVEIRVAPKRLYYEDHPEWEHPEGFIELTQLEYESLLSRFEALRPKGRLLQRATFTMVTNARAPYRDRYECAVVERGEVADVRRPESAPLVIRDFTIFFAAECSANGSGK